MKSFFVSKMFLHGISAIEAFPVRKSVKDVPVYCVKDVPGSYPSQPHADAMGLP
jgi:hypothetical protein